MQQRNKITLLVLIFAGLLMATGCASTKNGNCGCPNKQGMVGYK